MLRFDKVFNAAKAIKDDIKAGGEVTKAHREYLEGAVKLFKGTEKEKELSDKC
jgi:carbamoylphosphate synthase large subunit